MPPRSNDYQRVVYFIQKHLAADAEVTESAMLNDRRTGQPREVDVLVRGTMHGIPVAIAIEVRDRARKATVEWVEASRGRYEDLPVDKLVLVSRSGFTAAALAKASAYGIEAVTPSQNISPKGPLAALKVEISLLHVRWIEMKEASMWVDGQSQPQPMEAQTALFTPEGDEAMTIAAYTTAGLLDQIELDQTQLLDESDQVGKVGFDAVFEHPHMRVHATDEDVAAMVRDSSDNRLMQVDRMHVIWHAEITREPLDLEHGAIHGTPFAFGEFSALGQDKLVVVTPTDPRSTPTAPSD